MQPESFCYWLHGYSEITNRRLPNATEWAIINDHLDTVFTKVTPDRSQPDTMNWSGGYTPHPFVFNPDVGSITGVHSIRVC